MVGKRVPHSKYDYFLVHKIQLGKPFWGKALICKTYENNIPDL